MKNKLNRRNVNIVLAIVIVGILAAATLQARLSRNESVKSAADETVSETTVNGEDTVPDSEEALSEDEEKVATEATETAAAEDTGFSYGDKIFDTSYVHTVDLLITDWAAFVEDAPEEVYYNGSIVIDGERFDNVGIRAKGNSSKKIATKTGNGRYSLKIEFDHYIDGQSYYGLDKLHLNNLSYDSTCVKDYLSYYLMAEMGVPTSYCSYVFVTVNGEDHGLYIALEGIEESYLMRNFGEDYGNFLKPDDKYNQVVTESTEAETAKASETTQANETAAETTPANSVVSETASAGTPPAGQTSETQANSWLKEGQVEMATLTYVDDNIDSYVVLFNSARSDFSNKEKEKLIKSIKKLNEQKNLEKAIDIDEVMNYMTVQNFLVNYDGYTGDRVHNYYLYVDNDGIMSMLPWDYNLIFGTYGKARTASEVVNCPIDTPYGEEIGSRPMFDWIVESYAYREQYHDRLQYLVSNYISNGRLESEIDRVCAMISDYVKRDPTSWVTFAEYETGVNELKQLIALRGESIQLQVEGTIPSTAAGQAANPDSLLETGDLDPAKTSTSFGN